MSRLLKRWARRARHEFQKRFCCQIPRRLLNTVKFPHPVGIVIGDGVRIGAECRIYQNVTLGLLENTRAEYAIGQYPTIEDGVTIYAGAVIAGKLTIGAGAIIGANAVITHDVAPRTMAFGRNQFRPLERSFPADLARLGA